MVDFNRDWLPAWTLEKKDSLARKGLNGTENEDSLDSRIMTTYRAKQPKPFNIDFSKRNQNLLSGELTARILEKNKEDQRRKEEERRLLEEKRRALQLQEWEEKRRQAEIREKEEEKLGLLKPKGFISSVDPNTLDLENLRKDRNTFFQAPTTLKKMEEINNRNKQIDNLLNTGDFYERQKLKELLQYKSTARILADKEKEIREKEKAELENAIKTAIEKEDRREATLISVYQALLDGTKDENGKELTIRNYNSNEKEDKEHNKKMKDLLLRSFYNERVKKEGYPEFDELTEDEKKGVTLTGLALDIFGDHIKNNPNFKETYNSLSVDEKESMIASGIKNLSTYNERTANAKYQKQLGKTASKIDADVQRDRDMYNKIIADSDKKIEDALNRINFTEDALGSAAAVGEAIGEAERAIAALITNLTMDIGKFVTDLGVKGGMEAWQEITDSNAENTNEAFDKMISDKAAKFENALAEKLQKFIGKELMEELTKNFDSLSREVSSIFLKEEGSSKTLLTKEEKEKQVAKYLAISSFFGDQAGNNYLSNYWNDTIAERQSGLEKAWETYVGFKDAVSAGILGTVGTAINIAQTPFLLLGNAFYGDSLGENYRHLQEMWVDNPFLLLGSNIMETGLWAINPTKTYGSSLIGVNYLLDPTWVFKDSQDRANYDQKKADLVNKYRLMGWHDNEIYQTIADLLRLVSWSEVTKWLLQAGFTAGAVVSGLLGSELSGELMVGRAGNIFNAGKSIGSNLGKTGVRGFLARKTIGSKLRNAIELEMKAQKASGIPSDALLRMTKMTSAKLAAKSNLIYNRYVPTLVGAGEGSLEAISTYHQFMDSGKEMTDALLSRLDVLTHGSQEQLLQLLLETGYLPSYSAISLEDFNNAKDEYIFSLSKYKEQTEEAIHENALSAATMNMFFNSLVNGTLNTAMKSTLFNNKTKAALDVSLNKITLSNLLDRVNVVKVGEKWMSKAKNAINSSPKEVLKQIGKLGWSTFKEALGEGTEELLQNISNDFSLGWYMLNKQKFLEDLTSPMRAMSDADIRNGLLENSYEQLRQANGVLYDALTFDNAKVAIAGAFSTLLPMINVGGIASALSSGRKNGFGLTRKEGETKSNYLGRLFNTIVDSGVLRAYKELKRETDTDQKFADFLNANWLLNDRVLNLITMTGGSISLLNKMKQSLLKGDIVQALTDALASAILTATLLLALSGTEAGRMYIKNLLNLARLFEDGKMGMPTGFKINMGEGVNPVEVSYSDFDEQGQYKGKSDEVRQAIQQVRQEKDNRGLDDRAVLMFSDNVLSVFSETAHLTMFDEDGNYIGDSTDLSEMLLDYKKENPKETESMTDLEILLRASLNAKDFIQLQRDVRIARKEVGNTFKSAGIDPLTEVAYVQALVAAKYRERELAKLEPALREEIEKAKGKGKHNNSDLTLEDIDFIVKYGSMAEAELQVASLMRQRELLASTPGEKAPNLMSEQLKEALLKSIDNEIALVQEEINKQKGRNENREEALALALGESAYQKAKNANLVLSAGDIMDMDSESRNILLLRYASYKEALLKGLKAYMNEEVARAVEEFLGAVQEVRVEAIQAANKEAKREVSDAIVKASANTDSILRDYIYCGLLRNKHDISYKLLDEYIQNPQFLNDYAQLLREKERERTVKVLYKDLFIQQPEETLMAWEQRIDQKIKDLQNDGNLEDADILKDYKKNNITLNNYHNTLLTVNNVIERLKDHELSGKDTGLGRAIIETLLNLNTKAAGDFKTLQRNKLYAYCANEINSVIGDLDKLISLIRKLCALKGGKNVLSDGGYLNINDNPPILDIILEESGEEKVITNIVNAILNDSNIADEDKEAAIVKAITDKLIEGVNVAKNIIDFIDKNEKQRERREGNEEKEENKEGTESKEEKPKPSPVPENNPKPAPKRKTLDIKREELEPRHEEGHLTLLDLDTFLEKEENQEISEWSYTLGSKLVKVFDPKEIQKNLKSIKKAGKNNIFLAHVKFGNKVYTIVLLKVALSPNSYRIEGFDYLPLGILDTSKSSALQELEREFKKGSSIKDGIAYVLTDPKNASANLELEVVSQLQEHASTSFATPLIDQFPSEEEKEKWASKFVEKGTVEWKQDADGNFYRVVRAADGEPIVHLGKTPEEGDSLTIFDFPILDGKTLKDLLEELRSTPDSLKAAKINDIINALRNCEGKAFWEDFLSNWEYRFANIQKPAGENWTGESLYKSLIDNYIFLGYLSDVQKGSSSNIIAVRNEENNSLEITVLFYKGGSSVSEEHISINFSEGYEAALVNFLSALYEGKRSGSKAFRNFNILLNDPRELDRSLKEAGVNPKALKHIKESLTKRILGLINAGLLNGVATTTKPIEFQNPFFKTAKKETTTVNPGRTGGVVIENNGADKNKPEPKSEKEEQNHAKKTVTAEILQRIDKAKKDVEKLKANTERAIKSNQEKIKAKNGKLTKFALAVTSIIKKLKGKSVSESYTIALSKAVVDEALAEARRTTDKEGKLKTEEQIKKDKQKAQEEIERHIKYVTSTTFGNTFDYLVKNILHIVVNNSTNDIDFDRAEIAAEQIIKKVQESKDFQDIGGEIPHMNYDVLKEAVKKVLGFAKFLKENNIVIFTDVPAFAKLQVALGAEIKGTYPSRGVIDLMIFDPFEGEKGTYHIIDVKTIHTGVGLTSSGDLSITNPLLKWQEERVESYIDQTYVYRKGTKEQGAALGMEFGTNYILPLPIGYDFLTGRAAYTSAVNGKLPEKATDDFTPQSMLFASSGALPRIKSVGTRVINPSAKDYTKFLFKAEASDNKEYIVDYDNLSSEEQELFKAANDVSSLDASAEGLPVNDDEIIDDTGSTAATAQAEAAPPNPAELMPKKEEVEDIIVDPDAEGNPGEAGEGKSYKEELFDMFDDDEDEAQSKDNSLRSRIERKIIRFFNKNLKINIENFDKKKATKKFNRLTSALKKHLLQQELAWVFFNGDIQKLKEVTGDYANKDINTYLKKVLPMIHSYYSTYLSRKQAMIRNVSARFELGRKVLHYLNGGESIFSFIKQDRMPNIPENIWALINDYQNAKTEEERMAIVSRAQGELDYRKDLELEQIAKLNNLFEDMEAKLQAITSGSFNTAALLKDKILRSAESVYERNFKTIANHTLIVTDNSLEISESCSITDLIANAVINPDIEDSMASQVFKRLMPWLNITDAKITIKIVDKIGSNALTESLKKRLEVEGVASVYSDGYVINIAEDITTSSTDFARVLAHELLHVFIKETLAEEEMEQIESMLRELRYSESFYSVIDENNWDRYYGFSSAEEFLTEFFTNGAFLEVVKNLFGNSNNQSLYLNTMKLISRKVSTKINYRQLEDILFKESSEDPKTSEELNAEENKSDWDKLTLEERQGLTSQGIDKVEFSLMSLLAREHALDCCVAK